MRRGPKRSREPDEDEVRTTKYEVQNTLSLSRGIYAALDGADDSAESAG